MTYTSNSISGLRRDPAVEAQTSVSHIQSKVPQLIIGAAAESDHACVRVSRDRLVDFMRLARLDADLSFEFLVDITVIDWLDRKEFRFEVVYHLLSLTRGCRLRVKVELPENDPQTDSVVTVWPGANFMEREAWDMYGVVFKGHPDLRRILMYEEFRGHPLRKDYPVQVKQPCVKLRAPEVENSACRMRRPELLAVNPKIETEEPA